MVRCGQDQWKILNIFEDSISSLAQFQIPPKKLSLPPPPVIQDADGSLVEDEEAARGIRRTRLRTTRAKKGVEVLHGIKVCIYKSSGEQRWGEVSYVEGWGRKKQQQQQQGRHVLGVI